MDSVAVEQEGGKTQAVESKAAVNWRLARLAAMGANGILLQGVGDQAAGSVGSGFANGTTSGNSATAVGLGVSGTIFVKSGTGLAIYVEPN
jgi:hypothetical protein